MTIQQLLQSVQDDARPDQGIQFHLAQLSLRGRDIAGTRIVMFIIISRYVFCDLITILLQNIYIYCRRFLTCFFPENIGSSPVDVLCGSENKHDITEEPSEETVDDNGPTTTTEMFPCGL